MFVKILCIFSISGIVYCTYIVYIVYIVHILYTGWGNRLERGYKSWWGPIVVTVIMVIFILLWLVFTMAIIHIIGVIIHSKMHIDFHIAISIIGIIIYYDY